jgi:hypothetical protein
MQLDRNRVSRPGAWRVVAVILVTAWSGMPAAVSAQSAGPSPQMTVQGLWPAPTGHRQPHAWDLPPDVLRDEGMSARSPEPAPSKQPDTSRHGVDQHAGGAPFSDEQLKICRGC